MAKHQTVRDTANARRQKLPAGSSSHYEVRPVRKSGK